MAYDRPRRQRPGHQPVANLRAAGDGYPYVPVPLDELYLKVKPPMQLATSSALPGSDAAIDSCSDATPWHSHLRSQAAAIPWFQRQPILLTGRRGQAVLAGVVSSYYEKQLAQEFARRFEGVVEIDNRLEVRYRSFARLSDHHG